MSNPPTSLWSENPDTWIIDSGASYHMTGDPSYLVDAKPTQLVFEGIGGKVTATSGGTVHLVVKNCQGRSSLVLQQVYCVPGQRQNLVSTEQLCRWRIHYTNDMQMLYQTQEDHSITPLTSVYSRWGTPFLMICEKGAPEWKSKYEKLKDNHTQEVEELRAEIESLRAKLPEEQADPNAT